MRIPRCLAALAAGVGVASFVDPSPILLASPLCATFLFILLRKGRWRGFSLLAILFLAGAALYHLQLAPPNDPTHIRAFSGPTQVTVEGNLLSITKRPSGKTVLDIETKGVSSNRIEAPTWGIVRLHVGNGDVLLLPGDGILFLSKITPPRNFGIPGEFDYVRYLAARCIFATAYISDAKDLVRVPPTDFAPLGLIEQWRVNIENTIDRAVPAHVSSLVKALTVGLQTSIPPKTRELLTAGGISHLFAISGLHLGIVALFAYSISATVWQRSVFLLRFGPPRRYIPLLLLPLLWIYLLLAGNAVATRRAFIMACAAALLLFSKRRTDPLNLLAVAAFLLLLLTPLLLFEPAFQLSLAAVCGIVLLVPRWSAPFLHLPPLLRKGTILFLTTVAATLTTAPLVLFHFHQFSPAGLLVNLLAVPLVGFTALPLGLLGTLLTPLSAGLASVLFRGCGLILGGLLSLVEFVISTPYFKGWSLYLSPTAHFLLFLTVTAILLPKKSSLLKGIAYALPAIAIFILLLPGKTSSELSVIPLSIGQGDAVLLSLDGKRHILVDGGGRESETFDVGERLLAPALGRLGVTSLDAVILTHNHPDHWNGLPAVLENFPTKAFWTPLLSEDLPPALRAVTSEKKIAVVSFPEGWTVLDQTSTSTLALFAPPQDVLSSNDRSATLYGRLGDEGILLTGDLEEEGIARILKNPPPGPVSLLKVPHHGSRKSSPQRLLDRFNPSLLFVSLGSGNSYHFPHKEVTDAIRKEGIPLFRTDIHGTVKFETTGSGWETTLWKNGVFR